MADPTVVAADMVVRALADLSDKLETTNIDNGLRLDLQDGASGKGAALVAHPNDDGTTLADAPAFKRTAAEISAGVTPVDYRYPEGDVRRYGEVPDDGDLPSRRWYSKLYISDTGWNPDEDKVNGLTTPTNAQLVVGGKYDDDRLVSPNPGFYRWGIMGYQVNVGTAPVTPVMARARGQSVYTLSSSGRAYGVDPQIHGLEVTVGVFPSAATATVTSGSPTLTDIEITAAGEGSRFEEGMAISGTGIPAGTTISSVTGRPGAPTEIEMSASATASGSAVSIAAEPDGTIESFGILITGNNGTIADESTVPSIAIQVQAQNSQSRFARGINFGASSMQPDGRVFRMASLTAERGISFESVALENAIVFSNCECDGSFITFSGSESGSSGISFATSNVFSIAAINLPGQNIATDTTTGMKVATNPTQKMGFWGATPAVQPAAIADVSGGTTVDTEARAALNDLLAKLRTIGILDT